MAKTVTPGQLGAAIANELRIYEKDATKKLNSAGKAAVQELVKLTQAKAPMRTGSFASHIAWKKLETKNGCDTYVWYVKPPDHRITHLLVHGHATRNGGRVAGHSFLHDAWETVCAKYEKAVEDAFR